MAVDSSPLVVRHPDFGLTADAAVAWSPRRPEFACAANSVSALMPHMEPYFVRVVAAAVPHLEGELRDRARAFCRQEAEHHRQHGLFNRRLVARHPRLRLVERLAARFYRLLERRAGLRFNAAFVAASETVAYSAARWAAAHHQTLFDGADPAVTELFRWHLAEEVEHKAVAYDVFRALGCGWWRHLVAMMLVVASVLAFVAAGTTILLAGQRRLHLPWAWWRLTVWAVTFAFELVPNLTLSLFPGFHPDQLADPPWYSLWHLEQGEPIGGLSP